MAVLINLDITNQIKTTDYGYQINTSPPPVINFIIRTEHYTIDYSKLKQLRLVVESELTKRMETFTLNSTNLVTEDGHSYIKWTVPSHLVADLEKLNIDATVIMDSGNYRLKRFRLIVYRDYSVYMNGILSAIEFYNKMYEMYLDAIKRTEIGKPLGVVPLGSDGKIPNGYLDASWGKHIEDTLYDTLYTIDHIHGLKLDRKTYELLYYDSDDLEYYVANSIHGGQFGFINKPSPKYDVFGGYFEEDYSVVDGGNFGDGSESYVDAMTFSDELNEAISGGQFKDNLPSIGGGGFE